MGNWGGEVSKVLDFGRIRSHTFSCEDHAREGDIGLPDSTPGTIEDNSMLAHCFHELCQVLVLLLGPLAIGAYIVINCDDVGGSLS